MKRPQVPKPKEGRQVRSNVNVLVKIFFDCNGIMNSCHNVIRSIRNTALKFCGECAMQFVRNAKNCAETNHIFCTMKTDQLLHRYLCEYLDKNQTVIKPQPPYSPDLVSADLFSFQN